MHTAQSTLSILAIVLALATGAARADPPLQMSFPSGLPNLITPEQPLNILVSIAPGTQAIQPGTPAAHYRTNSAASFTTIPLQLVGGTDWSATIPAMPCSAALELYFSARGDGGALVHLPEDAPASVFRADVALLMTERPLEVMLQHAWPPGWSATGVWHITSACAPTGNLEPGCEEGPWVYFGRTSTCNYNLPLGTPGVLSAPVLTLPETPPGGHIRLMFCYALETENTPQFDKAEVFINGQTRPAWRVPDVRPGPGQPDRYWSTFEIDLTEFAGQVVAITWRFDTVNSLNNHFRGWHLNYVRILADVAGCPRACYANCDESTVDPILNIDDFTCFINEFASASLLPHEAQVEHYANCDGSTAAPALTVADFICFMDAFAAGCR